MWRRSYTGIILWWAWTSEKWYDLFCIWFYSRRKCPEGVLSDCWKLYWRGRFFPDSGSSTCRKKRDVPQAAIWRGKEAVGAFRFERRKLKANESIEYVVLAGATGEKASISKNLYSIWYEGASGKTSLPKWKKYWTEKVNVEFETGDEATDNYLKWICFQPIFKKNLWMFLPSISRLWKRRKRLERSLAGLPCTSDYESLKRPSDDRG